MSVAPDRVCVVVGRTRHKMIQAETTEAVKRGGKFVELRLDFLAKAVDFKRLLSSKQCPWMATIRRPQDGGRWPGSEEERQTVLRQAIVSGGFDWVDLETDIADKIRRFGPVKRVISYHNMIETPADLEGIYGAMLKQDADVYKIAVMAQTMEDNARILALMRSAPKPTVAFCMGDLGFPTRFLALKYGAPWLYAAFNRERGLAPGMPAVEDLRTTYPVRMIDAATMIYGLLGDPVEQSFSPVLHNHMFRRNKLNALYLPFRVPKDQLTEALRTYGTVPVNGYSVTIPHKEAAAALTTDHDLTVRITHAANTLLRRPDGTFAADNTDFTAIVDCLEAHLAERAAKGLTAQLNQLFVMILGAGGAARAVAHALHARKAHVYISARTSERATKLSTEIGGKVVDWQGRHNVLPCDVVINCTPVGMHPNTDESPVHHSFLKPEMTVFDTVYSPENTMLVREAKSRGCLVITGVDMFVRQAARQFELFTGIAPPLETMRELLRKAMSPVTRALDEVSESGEGTANA